MYDLIVLNSQGVPATSSLAIARKFRKEHKNILRDIKNLECSEEFRRLNFEQSSYLNAQKKSQPMFLITRDGWSILIMSFTGKQATQWKEDYIEAFNQMEALLNSRGMIRSKTEFHDQMVNAQGCYTFGDVGKMLEITGGRNIMLKLFRDNGILMKSDSEKNMPYQGDIDKGYFRVVPIIIKRGKQQVASKQVFVTPKGLTWLQKLIIKKGLLPAQELVEIDLEAKYGKPMDDIMMSVFFSDIEKNKKNAVLASDTVKCCGKLWKMEGKVCGSCGRSLDFTKKKRGGSSANSFRETIKRGEKIADVCERFVDAVKSTDEAIAKHSVK